MAEMTPFKYGGFYDVPRCLHFRYRGRGFLLLSGFEEAVDEYQTDYWVYVIPESADHTRPICSPEFLSNTPMDCLGQIPIHQVRFDATKRKELDASIVDGILDDHERRANLKR